MEPWELWIRWGTQLVELWSAAKVIWHQFQVFFLVRKTDDVMFEHWHICPSTWLSLSCGFVSFFWSIPTRTYLDSMYVPIHREFIQSLLLLLSISMQYCLDTVCFKWKFDAGQSSTPIAREGWGDLGYKAKYIVPTYMCKLVHISL